MKGVSNGSPSTKKNASQCNLWSYHPCCPDFLSLFFTYTQTVSAFFPGRSTLISGWEMVSSWLSTALLGSLLLASLFWPPLLFLINLWFSFKPERGWPGLLGSGAIVSVFLDCLGFAFFMPAVIFHNYDVAITFGLASWVPTFAFFCSFCCNIVLASSLLRSRRPIGARLMKKDDALEN